MEQIDLKRSAAELFREVFEGRAEGADGTWFVEGKQGMLDAVKSLSATNASRRIEGQPSSIGAHVRHLTHYLSLHNGHVRNENPIADWEGSWSVQEFEDAAWQETVASLDREYKFALAWYESRPNYMDQEQATYALANIAHTAYHLGAIRALLPLV